MRDVSDAYLLTIAEVSATLIGLFLVGAFFYADTGLRRLGPAREAFEPYLRAGSRIMLIVFAIPLVLSISLVTMEPAWSRVLFLFLSGAVFLLTSTRSAGSPRRGLPRDRLHWCRWSLSRLAA